MGGLEVIEAGVEAARRQLGEGLISAYAIGSLATPGSVSTPATSTWRS
jgi:hypothetical protein